MTEDSANITPLRNVSYYTQNSSYDYWLFHEPPSWIGYGIIVPIIACIGIIANVITFSVFQNPAYKSLATSLLNAALMADNVFLLCCGFLLAPKAWLHLLYAQDDHGPFWRTLAALQNMHLGCYPLYLISKCLALWYPVALTIALWVSLSKPGKFASIIRGDHAHKVVVIIMNIVIAFHIISFFKYTRMHVSILDYHLVPGNDSNSSVLAELPINAKEICLTDVYSSTWYQNYELYAYFLLAELVPLGAATGLLVLCILRHRNMADSISSVSAPNVNILRVLSIGGSIRMMLAVLGVQLIIQTCTKALYIYMVPDFGLVPSRKYCDLAPNDGRTEHMGYDLTFYYLPILASSIKPFVCLFCSSFFRRYWGEMCLWNRNMFRAISSRMFTRPRATPEEEQEIDTSQSSMGEGNEYEYQSNSDISTYYDAVSYSTAVGTPMLLHDFPRAIERPINSSSRLY